MRRVRRSSPRASPQAAPAPLRPRDCPCCRGSVRSRCRALPAIAVLPAETGAPKPLHIASSDSCYTLLPARPDCDRTIMTGSARTFGVQLSSALESLTHTTLLFVAYAAVALFWLTASRVLPYWRSPPRAVFVRPWRELGF